MNEDDKQSGAGSTDSHQSGKKFPKDELGLLKINHEEPSEPKYPKTPSIPKVQAAKPKVDVPPKVNAPEIKQSIPEPTITNTPKEPIKKIDTVDPIVPMEQPKPVETIEPPEPTPPTPEEISTPKSIDALPVVAFVPAKKNKRRAVILAAVIVSLFAFTGASAWWLLGDKEIAKSQSEDSSQTAADKPKSGADEKVDDSGATDTTAEQKPETTEETTFPPSENAPPEKPAVQAPVVEQPKEEPAPPAPQTFERGTMVLSATDDLIEWSYTGKAIYGYKLVYNKQTVKPTVEKHPYISFNSINEKSLSLPTDRLPEDVWIVRVCAYTGNTSGDICVDYSNYVVIRNY